MAEATEGQATACDRVATGVPGLDVILEGGLLRGSCNLIFGAPGSGKTVLASQIAAHHVAHGGRAVFVTLLTEIHGRMFANLRSFRFFDERYIPEALYFVSGYAELEKGGLGRLGQMIGQLVREREATLLVVDGLAVAQLMAESKVAFQKFLYNLYSLISSLRCTTLLLSTGSESPTSESAMVESVVCLSDELVGLRAVRELYVSKFRGSDYLRGRHVFVIDGGGVTVHPRLEALVSRRMPLAPERKERLPFGIPRFDAMLEGGIFTGSTTMVLGAPGSGKTLLGVSFLAEGARRGEPGLHFGFYESPDRLMGKADALGLGFAELVKQGTIEIAWQLPMEGLVDQFALQVLEKIERRKVRRLFIDGLDALSLAMVYPDRLSAFFTALTAELRARDVTTLFTMETELFPSDITVTTAGVSAMVENIILLRYVELHAHLHRMISILKVRESSYDSSLREFSISEQGIDVAETFESAEAILSGYARTPPVAPPRKGGHGRSLGT